MSSPVGKRVLMLIENSPYPQDSRVRQEAITLLGAGYQVSVICPAAPGQPRRQVLDGVSIFRYPPPPDGNNFLSYIIEYGYSIIATFVLAFYVWFRRGFDIIHAANPPDTTVFVAVFFKLFGKRFVFDHHDLSPELYDSRFSGKGSRFIRNTLVWLEKFSCQFADKVIATNQSYKAIEMQRGSISEPKIVVVRNGPDMKRFKDAEPRADLRKEGKINLVYVGIIERQDGVDFLLRALVHLRKDLKRDDFYCFIVGKGGALADLKSLASELKLDEYVGFTGFIDPSLVASYLCAGDIGIAPEPSNPLNDHSTFIKIMEYMAMGKPIVAFDLHENRFTAQGAALYAQPNDELDFARKIAALMDDEACRKAMGKAGRERVERELTWEQQAKNLVAAYDSIWKPRPVEPRPSKN